MIKTYLILVLRLFSIGFIIALGFESGTMFFWNYLNIFDLGVG